MVRGSPGLVDGARGILNGYRDERAGSANDEMCVASCLTLLFGRAGMGGKTLCT